MHDVVDCRPATKDPEGKFFPPDTFDFTPFKNGIFGLSYV
jgi:hypothetical protein